VTRLLILVALTSCTERPQQVDAGQPVRRDAGEPVRIDAGHLVIRPKCDRWFSASDSSAEAAAALADFMTSEQHAPCPGVGCDSTVAIPWCGPFFVRKDGAHWAGGLFAAKGKRTVVTLSAWSGVLYFAAPEVEDPLEVELERVVGLVIVPKQVGPFQTRPQGFGMRSDAGVAEPPTRCLAEFCDPEEVIKIPANWRFYWRPRTYPEWMFCGPITPR
jgi:hypothetical protein